MPPPIAPAARLRAALDRLAEAVEAVGFGLPSASSQARRERRDRVAGSIRRFLLPRLRDPDAPLLVVVFGPTGSGKSTLLNSLAGREVSSAGALRPTTRAAVAWCHRREAGRYEASPLAATGPLRLVPDDHPVLERLTVVDTPDVDSHVEEHRRQTEAILDLADAAVYVTTAQRYADAVPWELLSGLAERRLPLLVVVNRLTRRSGGAVIDLASLMRDAGIEEASRADDLVTIQEQRIRGERLPPAAVRRVGRHLEGLASAAPEVVERSVLGSLAVVRASASALCEEVEAQRAEAEALWSAAERAYRQQAEEIAAHLAAGQLVRAEVVLRWQRLVGVGELAGLVARGAGRLRDMVLPRDPVRSEAASRVEEEARRELADLAVFRAGRAVASVAAAWELDPAGRALLAPRLRQVGEETRELAASEVDEWLAGLVALVRDVGRPRFHLARAASVGINAAAVLLLLGVFVSTGGLSGAEVGITAGAAAAQQSLLEHLFGNAAARRLAERARRDLVERLGRVLFADAARFREALDAAVDPPGSVVEIQEALRAVEIEVERRG